MDFSIVAPSVKKYRVYTPIPYRGVKKRNYTPDGKKRHFCFIFVFDVPIGTT